MPQQPNLLLDFNPAPQGGQFSDILTQPLQQERQPSGWSGPTGDTFMLASKFLGGMQEGKIQKFLKDEQRIARQQQAMGAYVQATMQDLPPEAQKELTSKYAGVLAQMAQTQSPNEKRTAGKKAKSAESGKDPGIMGKVGDTLIGILSGMAGGNVPQHGKVQSMGDFMMDIETAKLTDPKWRPVTQTLQSAKENATKAIDAIPEQDRTSQKIADALSHHGLEAMALSPDAWADFTKSQMARALPENQFQRMVREVGGLPGDSLLKAKEAYLGIREPTRDQYGKAVHGNQLPPDTLDAFGRPVNPDYDYVPKTPAGGGRTVYEPTVAAASGQIKASDLVTYVDPRDPQKNQKTYLFKQGKFFDANTMREEKPPEGWVKRAGGVMPLQTRPVDVEAKLMQINDRYTTLYGRVEKTKQDAIAKIEHQADMFLFNPTMGLAPEKVKPALAEVERRFKEEAKFYQDRYDNQISLLNGMHAKPLDRNMTGTVAETHNNPMNLEDGATGQIREFGSVEEGWQADMAQVRRKVNGMGVLQPKLETLRDFFNDWAPKGDGKNDPDHYAATVADWMGVKPDTKLSSLKGREEELGRFVARFEGYKNWQSLGAKTQLPPKGTPPPASAGRTISSQELFK